MPPTRPVTTAHHFAISSGHDLASRAGFEILEAGGNAIDAGVAAGIALGVLHSDLVNVAGVAPIMIRLADTGRVVTIDGLGTWPRAASVELFETEYGGAIPDGILRYSYARVAADREPRVPSGHEDVGVVGRSFPGVTSRVLAEEDAEDRELLGRSQPLELDRHVLRPRLAEKLGDVPTGAAAHEAPQGRAQELGAAR